MNRFYKKIISLGFAGYLSFCSGCVGINKDGGLYIDRKDIAEQKVNWNNTLEEMGKEIDNQSREGKTNLREFGNGLENELRRFENFIISLGKFFIGNPEEKKERGITEY